MSNSNNFTKNIHETNINNAYQYQTFSNYVTDNNILNPKYSHKCIFCSNTTSTSLTQDGSFRQCCRCKKQFRGVII